MASLCGVRTEATYTFYISKVANLAKQREQSERSRGALLLGLVIDKPEIVEAAMDRGKAYLSKKAPEVALVLLRGSSFKDLTAEHKDAFRNLRERVRDVSKYLADFLPTGIETRAFWSMLNPSGRVAPDYWGCVFPVQVGNKSYAFQLAFIIGRDGVEVRLGWC